MDDGLTPKLQWRVARVVDSEPETESAQTIGLAVPGWGGHLAGQHVDLKLTAEDGYSAQRSYSLSRPADGERIELTVQQIAHGEVSPYLTGVRPGEEIELRGPIGGWFVWRPVEQARILLVAGGSGIVPLMAMVRQRIVMGSTEFRLVYSVRSPGDYVFAGASGAAVIPAGDLSAVLHAAYQVVAADAESVVTITGEKPKHTGRQ